LGSFSCDNTRLYPAQLAAGGGQIHALVQGCAVLGITPGEEDFATFLGPNKFAHKISFIPHSHHKLSGMTNRTLYLLRKNCYKNLMQRKCKRF